MKKIIDTNIGGISFAIEDDAYFVLKTYLNKFEASIKNSEDIREVMEDIEMRIAELFLKRLRTPGQVVDENMVREVIDCLGEPTDAPHSENSGSANPYNAYDIGYSRYQKRLFRDVENKNIAGVCSGLAIYFGVEVLLIRLLFLAALIIGASAGFWIYIALWIVVPKAITVAQKLQMLGIPVTEENIRKYSSYFRK